jgi:hypothetical protein
MTRSFLSVAALAALLSAGGGAERAFADTEQIAITNPGFEDPMVTAFNHGPIMGWTISGSGGGVWNINSDPMGFWNVPAPEGNQIAYLSPGPAPGLPAEISQTLSATLQANTFYRLTGQVGDPLGFAMPEIAGWKKPSPAGSGTAVFTAKLFAGSNLLASTSGIPVQGSFQQFTVTFDSTGSPFLGEALKIELESSRAQTGYDEIALSAQTTPEPSSLALFLGVGLSSLMGYAWRRRRPLSACRPGI